MKSPDTPMQSADGPAGTLGVLTLSAEEMLTVRHGDHPETTEVCAEHRARARTQYDPALKVCCASLVPHPVWLPSPQSN